MASLLGASGGGLRALGAGLGTFALQMVVGAAVGVAGGYLLREVAVRLPCGHPALHPLRVIASAGAIYGAGTVLHGSGFLAVFLAGIVVGDVETPASADGGAVHRRPVQPGRDRRVHRARVDRRSVARGDRRRVGAGRRARRPDDARGPAAAGRGGAGAGAADPAGSGCSSCGSGLKGAVPILLGTFLLLEDVPQARRLYDIIFVVVLISVVVQGGTVPLVARKLRIPMRSDAAREKAGARVATPHPGPGDAARSGS